MRVNMTYMSKFFKKIDEKKLTKMNYYQVFMLIGLVRFDSNKPLCLWFFFPFVINFFDWTLVKIIFKIKHITWILKLIKWTLTQMLLMCSLKITMMIAMNLSVYQLSFMFVLVYWNFFLSLSTRF